MSSEAVFQDDPSRLALLHASRLLDSAAHPAYEALLRLLTSSLRCDNARIHLVDAHRLCCLAGIGAGPRIQGRAGTTCDRIVRTGEPLIIHDAQTWDGEAAAGWGAYMGWPLKVEGHVLGVVVVTRNAAQAWADQDQVRLGDMAEAAAALMLGQLQAQRSQLMEDRVRMASLAGSDWLWETDAEGRLQWVSAGLSQHLGVDPATEIGLKGAPLYRPRDDETRASWDRFMQARARHEPFTDAIAERDTPRGTITVSISGRPVFNERGEFAGYRGASRVITRQLRIEQEARRADQWLREAFDAFPLSVMISDPQGQILLANRQWWRQIGPALEGTQATWPDILRQLIRDGVYPEAVGREDAFWRWRMDLHIQAQSQEVRFRDQWLIVRDHQLPDGCVVHFSLDITRAKEDAAQLLAQQRALADTQARLGAVLKALPDLWFVLDEQGRHVAGHEHHPMLLQPLENLHGRKLGDNLPPHAARQQQEALARLQTTGRPQRLEYDLVTAEGMQRHFEARLTLMPEGHTLFITRDITERQLAAEKLRVSEELYRSVAATISDGLMIVELAGRVVALNPAASRILGVQHDILGAQQLHTQLGITWLEDDLSQPLGEDRCPMTSTLVRGERVVDRVHPLRRPDGEVVWVQVSSHLLRVSPEASPFAAMATLRDISRERHAQQALQQSEERWKFALEGAGDGVWDWDLRSGQVYFSPHWKAQLGYEDHELPNTRKAFLSLIHPDEHAQVSEGLRRIVNQADTLHQAEFRMRHRHGHYLDILSRGRMVQCDAEGRAQRLVGTHSDITRLKQAERALLEKETAEAANAAKTEFLSRMSHEVRTPLNAIIGFAQLLQLQIAQEGTGTALATHDVSINQRYVHQILLASRHLMGLVNDVLDLQKVEAGVLNFKPEPVCLRDEVRQCLDMLSPLAERGRVTLHNQVEGDWPLMLDRQRLRQIIMNIASNAIKYNQIGGTVHIHASELSDGQVELQVNDSGEGMSPRQLARLFQPFERLGRETTNADGTGLGLIITRSLIEAMGGRMVLRSELGVGTRVSLMLPMPAALEASPTASLQVADAVLHRKGDHTADIMSHSEPPDDAPASRQIASEPPATVVATQGTLQRADCNPLRVLYVEDNRINAMLFEEALRPFEQIQLDIAEDGQMALSMVRAQAPHVLVLDAHLPGMSGFDVLKALRTLPSMAEVPAFMCSADAMPDDIARAREAGFAGYWTKPIDIVAVTDELCRLAERPPNSPT
jgi:PAS domain S-box-containing protein